jgi:glycosyltransferase involved in cell wall biosynthesis
LAAERPVVATDLPIFADARDDLVLVEPGNRTMMEEALRRILYEPAWREHLAQQVAKAARRFSWAAIVSEHREVYVAARAAFQRRAALTSNMHHDEF